VVLCDKENIDERGRYMGVPALVVEVLSPGTRSKDLLKKLNLYQACGIREYWIVDPEQEQINIYAFGDEDRIDHRAYTVAQETAASLTFEGLAVSVKEVFSA